MMHSFLSLPLLLLLSAPVASYKGLIPAQLSYPPNPVLTQNALNDYLCSNAADTTPGGSCAGHVATSETPFLTKYRIPAGYLANGNAIRVTFGMQATISSGSPNVTFNVLVGGTKMVTSNTIRFDDKEAHTNWGYTFVSVIISRSPVDADSYAYSLWSWSGPEQFNNTIQQTIPFDNRPAMDLQLSMNYSSNLAGNWIFLHTMLVELLRA